MAQSIETKYYHDKNGNPKISATSASKRRIILFWDDSLDEQENHNAAVIALCNKYDWKGKLAYGGSLRGLGYTYVFVEEHSIVSIHKVMRVK